MRKQPADTGKKTQKFIETQRANKKKHQKKQTKLNKTIEKQQNSCAN